MTIQIRNYTSADYPTICKLDEPLFPDMGGTVLVRHIEELFGPLFFVAEDNGKIIGYILGGIHIDNPKVGKLIRVGVEQTNQKKNCGTLLTSALFTRMKAMGIETVHLTVDENNIPARNFYHKIGFTLAEKRSDYYYPNKSRLILTKKL